MKQISFQSFLPAKEKNVRTLMHEATDGLMVLNYITLQMRWHDGIT